MKIVCNGHSIFDSCYVTTLSECSIPVSLIEGNDFAFVVKFYGDNFKKLLTIAMGDPSIAEKLMLRKELYSKKGDILNEVSSECFLEYEVDDFCDSQYFCDVTDCIRGSCETWGELSEKNLMDEMNSQEGFEKIKLFLESFEIKSKARYEKSKKTRDDYVALNPTPDFDLTGDHLIVSGMLLSEGQKHRDFLQSVKEYVEVKSPYFLNKKNYDDVIAFDLKINEIYNLINKTDLNKWVFESEESYKEARNIYELIFKTFKFYCD